MRQRLFGAASGLHTALIGVWDPLLASHGELFRHTVRDASANSMGVLVITLFPAPAAHLQGEKSFPPFHDVTARLAFQERCGIQARLHVSLTRQEIDQEGVAFLLDRVRHEVDIGELALGAGQSLGREERGNRDAIARYCERHGIRLRTLGAAARDVRVHGARRGLREGRVRDVVKCLDQPLYWARPQSGVVRLPWPPGRYAAVPFAEPDLGATADAPTVPVELRAEADGGAVFDWPRDGAPWLGFVAGPADAG